MCDVVLPLLLSVAYLAVGDVVVRRVLGPIPEGREGFSLHVLLAIFWVPICPLFLLSPGHEPARVRRDD